MECTVEKRVHRRLDVKLPVDYCHLDTDRGGDAGRSTTVNVSTGGVYFETTNKNIKAGDILALELGVTSDDNRFPPDSKIATTGKVLRTAVLENRPDRDKPSYTSYGIAAKFSKGFKLAL